MDLFLVHLLGACLIFPSYFYYLPKIKSEVLWAGMPKSLRPLYMIFIVIVALSFLIGMWAGGDDDKLKWAFVIFYIGAALWPVSVYYNNKLMVLFALCMTSLGALLLSLWSPRYLLFLIVFLHVLIMDNIIWYRYYLTNC
jgi:hypothetical protein